MPARIEYMPPGYDPSLDQRPPRKVSARPLIMIGVSLFVACWACTFGVLAYARNQAGPDATPTIEATLDEWSQTGTAIYEQTATGQTPTNTPEWHTPTPTGTLTSTPLTRMPDEWAATGTAIYLATNPATATATATAAPTSTRRPAASSGGGNSYVRNPYPTQPPPTNPPAAPPTQRPVLPQPTDVQPGPPTSTPIPTATAMLILEAVNPPPVHTLDVSMTGGIEPPPGWVSPTPLATLIATPTIETLGSIPTESVNIIGGIDEAPD